MSKRILVIDDEESLRDLACTCLEDLGGWETISAPSGHEGLLQAQDDALDVILLDVSMPDMDGFQFYKQIKANPKTHEIPIILLTAKVLPDDYKRFAQLQIAGVINKPFNPILICEQIAQMLDWRE
ncbi:response regulator receiver domain protein [Nostoc sp. HK-01]|uniref:Response regulator receiver domain protein n=2 Tax=Nostocales TaxID=1161 RepID=A0A1Z4GAK4_9CYAN|nr:response regulator [Nostoc cycadae]BAY14554.1 response regulator receiver domain protein [Anabaenopsis circularis NIES-21]BBD61276.1 response regulator receiver domain protein [Nostoc sp. HK-01]GBE92242.1 chemotaxis protein CheY [Nostoc cycadae WK-1]